MSELWAIMLVFILETYTFFGLLFAVPFVWFAVQKLDSETQGSGFAFRLLILPGVAAFWPLLLHRLLRGSSEPPLEHNPHRNATR
jgi:hypothetical protein